MEVKYIRTSTLPDLHTRTEHAEFVSELFLKTESFRVLAYFVRSGQQLRICVPPPCQYASRRRSAQNQLLQYCNQK